MDTPFVIDHLYNAPIDKVWQTLSNEDSMKEWYFSQLESFEPVVGYDFLFSNDGSPYQKARRVTKVVDAQLLAHSWIYKDHPGSSEVPFELFADGERTRLKLTHTRLDSFQPIHILHERDLRMGGKVSLEPT
ncbi:MAG: SRPBCC domain-containing protein [Pedobacter sp.]|nr:MAG: SRPBCC domain-containing protein [Pedobacter sp.]